VPANPDFRPEHALVKQFPYTATYFSKTSFLMKTTGIILIVIGAVMLAWTGFTYTKKEKVVDAGPIEISADKQKTVNWPPYVGGILLVGGIVALLAAPKGRRYA
jgi:hypothetical protein